MIHSLPIFKNPISGTLLITLSSIQPICPTTIALMLVMLKDLSRIKNRLGCQEQRKDQKEFINKLKELSHFHSKERWFSKFKEDKKKQENVS